MVPIILLCGNAGCGKDTVAGFIAKHNNAALVAQADPMKRLAMNIFQFGEEALWGPSEKRNERFRAYTPIERWESARARLEVFRAEWLRDVLPDLGAEQRLAAGYELGRWFADVKRYYSQDPEGCDPTARYVLQTLGTEWGRKVDQDMWSRGGLRAARALLIGGKKYDRIRGLHDAPTPGYDWSVITDGRFRNEIINVKQAGGIAVLIESPEENAAALASIEKAGAKGHVSEAELKKVPRHFYDYVLINDKSFGLAVAEHRTVQFMRELSRPKAA